MPDYTLAAGIVRRVAVRMVSRQRPLGQQFVPTSRGRGGGRLRQGSVDDGGDQVIPDARDLSPGVSLQRDRDSPAGQACRLRVPPVGVGGGGEQESAGPAGVLRSGAHHGDESVGGVLPVDTGPVDVVDDGDAGPPADTPGQGLVSGEEAGATGVGEMPRERGLPRSPRAAEHHDRELIEQVLHPGRDISLMESVHPLMVTPLCRSQRPSVRPTVAGRRRR